MPTIAESVASVLSTLLAQQVAVGDDVNMSTCQAWDSLKHIEIIMTVEQTFGISISPEHIPLLTSQHALVSEVAQLVGHD